MRFAIEQGRDDKENKGDSNREEGSGRGAGRCEEPGRRAGSSRRFGEAPSPHLLPLSGRDGVQLILRVAHDVVLRLRL